MGEGDKGDNTWEAEGKTKMRQVLRVETGSADVAT